MMLNRPQPAIIVLEDRADGTLWQLHHSVERQLIGITDASMTVFKHAAVRQYPAGEEPVLGTSPTIRLIVRDGYLGYAVEDLEQSVTDRDCAPILTRLTTSSARFYFELNYGDSTRHWQTPGDTLGYTEFVE